MNYQVQIKDKKLQGKIHIAGSKSESNRLLILQALHPEIQVKNLSFSKDTEVLQEALKSSVQVINVGHAGTAMRFLTAYFAAQPNQEVALRGSQRMHQRPIKPLVDALRQLGANIQYLEKEGFPPLKITGKQLEENKIEIQADISSQFITAMLLIATKFEKDVSVSLTEEITSRPYILMTLALIEKLGIKTSFKRNNITVFSRKIIPTTFFVEPDWSSASYFYSMAALSENAEIILPGFRKESLQGDAQLVEIYKQFGVKTIFLEIGIKLIKVPAKLPIFLELNLNQTPDIAQTIAVTCLGLGVECQLIGLKTLAIKETNRLKALKSEIEKFGAKVIIDNNSLTVSQIPRKLEDTKLVKTYDDHRMALAFTPLALKTSLAIENVEVVKKSFPNFWQELKKLNFEYEEMS